MNKLIPGHRKSIPSSPTLVALVTKATHCSSDWKAPCLYQRQQGASPW
jgi:hypothetical protein